VNSDATRAGILELIALVNSARAFPAADRKATASEAHAAAARLEADFAVSRTLAVYGSLAPGKENHHIVAPLGGEWTPGIVEGDLNQNGWGASLGYSAFHPREGGTAVPAQVLSSEALADAWPMLDDFEGADYRRILVPVFARDSGTPRQLLTVANLYASAT